jgi:hypothetical protein
VKRVHLHVDCLAVRGLAPQAARAVGKRLQVELAKLLATGESERLAARADTPRVRVEGPRLAQGESAERMGAAFARSIAKGLSR